MLAGLIRWTLHRPRLVLAAALLFLIYGGVVLSHAKLDVFPEFLPATAEVQTEAPGLSAEQVEQLVTRPVEQAVAGAANVATVRSESQQGLSKVTVVFRDGAEPYRARQIVAEALSSVGASLPAGMLPQRLRSRWRSHSAASCCSSKSCCRPSARATSCSASPGRPPRRWR